MTETQRASSNLAMTGGHSYDPLIVITVHSPKWLLRQFSLGGDHAAHLLNLNLQQQPCHEKGERVLWVSQSGFT